MVRPWGNARGRHVARKSVYKCYPIDIETRFVPGVSRARAEHPREDRIDLFEMITEIEQRFDLRGRKRRQDLFVRLEQVESSLSPFQARIAFFCTRR